MEELLDSGDSTNSVGAGFTDFAGGSLACRFYGASSRTAGGNLTRGCLGEEEVQLDTLHRGRLTAGTELAWSFQRLRPTVLSSYPPVRVVRRG
jgi:hypothetical protein